MFANQLRVDRVRLALWIALAALAFAAPAQAVVVQYTGTLTSGFGDGGATGDPGGFDTANNAFPACNPVAPTPLMSTTKGLGGWIATEGSAMFVGTANVVTGPAPQAVQFATANLANGLVTTCQISIPNIQPQLTKRIQTTTLIWPAYAGSFMAGGGFAGPTTAPFTFMAPATFPKQTVIASTITAMAPPGPGARFGGALRVNGAINAQLVARATGPGPLRLKGSLPARLSVGAQGGPATPTFIPTVPTTGGLPGPITGKFDLMQKTAGSALVLIAPNYVTGSIKEAFFPWTTGMVVATDSTGQFFTFRSRKGFDNRNAAGTSGTLQLVTPAVVLIQGIGAPLPFMPTSVLTLQFTPEPGATLLLAAGALTLLGLHAVRRRRS